MDDSFPRMLVRLRAGEIKRKDMILLFEAGCYIETIAKLYRVPAWVVINKCAEFGIHKNYYTKIQLEKRPSFDIKSYKHIMTDLFVRTVLEIGYSYTYPSQSELARGLEATYSNITMRTLPFLHERGFIEFVRKDKKTKRVKLTEKGLVLFQRFVEVVGLIENK